MGTCQYHMQHHQPPPPTQSDAPSRNPVTQKSPHSLLHRSPKSVGTPPVAAAKAALALLALIASTTTQSRSGTAPTSTSKSATCGTSSPQKKNQTHSSRASQLS